MQATSPFPGSGYRLGESEDTLAVKAMQFVTHSMLPKLYQWTPAAAATALRDRFWIVPATAFAVSMAYDKTFTLDAGLASAAGLISYADHKVPNSQLIKKTSLSLLALHVIKCGFNSYKFGSTFGFSNLLGASIDLCIAAKHGLILLNRS